MAPKINVIVAACTNNGIGCNGELPWRLSKEMKHFAKMTKQTSNPDRQNAVIMGRKTWESIPGKFRPLAGRKNIVISSKIKENNNIEEGLWCISYNDALKKAEENGAETIWIIGGKSVYGEALNTHVDRIYLTRILKEFNCDIFLPKINFGLYDKISDPNVCEGIQEEKEIKYQYEIYERKLE